MHHHENMVKLAHHNITIWHLVHLMKFWTTLWSWLKNKTWCHLSTKHLMLSKFRSSISTTQSPNNLHSFFTYPWSPTVTYLTSMNPCNFQFISISPLMSPSHLTSAQQNFWPSDTPNPFKPSPIMTLTLGYTLETHSLAREGRWWRQARNDHAYAPSNWQMQKQSWQLADSRKWRPRRRFLNWQKTCGPYTEPEWSTPTRCTPPKIWSSQDWSNPVMQSWLIFAATSELWTMSSLLMNLKQWSPDEDDGLGQRVDGTLWQSQHQGYPLSDPRPEDQI